ncbi:MAG: hypothetical protein Q8Q37_00330 [bacterium]|nr:hypothetical protein [bacterium]
MFNKINNFINDIRQADERRRKRWFVFTSGICVIVVVFLWLTFLNLDSNQNVNFPATNESLTQQSGIIAKMADIRKTLGNGLLAISDKLGIKNRFTVRADNRNFILDGLAPVLPINLP